MDKYNFEDNNEQLQNKDTIELNAKDIFEITTKFSGIGENKEPKSVVTYCAYDFDAPEDDVDKNSIYYVKEARVELSFDHKTGFYTMDLIFDNPDNKELKLFWARLQKHKSNETFLGDKLWIFYINLTENDFSESDNGNVFTASIMNPLLFFLTRKTPDQMLSTEEPLEDDMLQGGNCIRMLLHKDLVSFRYIAKEDLEDDEDTK